MLEYETQNPVKIINRKIKEGYVLVDMTSWDLKSGKRNYILRFSQPAEKNPINQAKEKLQKGTAEWHTQEEVFGEEGPS